MKQFLSIEKQIVLIKFKTFHTKLKNTKVQIEGNHNAPRNLITQTSLLFRNKLTDSTSYFMRKGMLLLLSEVWPWRNIPNNYYAAETKLYKEPTEKSLAF